jgi:hypothetical protein
MAGAQGEHPASGPPRLRADGLIMLAGWPFQGGARNTGTPISCMLASFRRLRELSPGDIPASFDAGHPRLVLDSSAPEKVMHLESN